ncbi:MAG: hypothetical protein LJE85_09215 [Gammaproteobacteria bacterium]|nr:hypothetical protein [Gammaproteobacteria bacterium]
MEFRRGDRIIFGSRPDGWDLLEEAKAGRHQATRQPHYPANHFTIGGSVV